jgi:hypothetical protein
MLKDELGEAVKVALRQEDSCLITFYSQQSLTDFTREMK